MYVTVTQLCFNVIVDLALAYSLDIDVGII